MAEPEFVRWQVNEEERREFVGILEPAGVRSPKLAGVSLSLWALAVLMIGIILVALTGGEGDIAAAGTAGIIFALIWLVLRSLARLAGNRRHSKLLAGPAEIVVAPDHVVIFGETCTWSVTRAWSQTHLEGAHLEDREGRPWLVVDLSYLSTRGSTEFQRLPSTCDVPVPTGRQAEAEQVAGRLRAVAQSTRPKDDPTGPEGDLAARDVDVELQHHAVADQVVRPAGVVDLEVLAVD